MNHQTFKGGGTFVPPKTWPTSGVRVVLSLEGTVRVTTSTTTQSLDPCTGAVLSTLKSVDYDGAKGLVVSLDPGSSTSEESIVLDPLAAHLILDVFFDNRKDDGHRLSALQFLLRHLGLMGGATITDSDADGSVIDRALAHFQGHLDEPLTLENVAEEVGCGVQTLIKNFQAARGQSPMHCLAELRLHRAKTLLAETETSITQVAHSVGYSTISGFSHFFKKQTGFSPREFRENVQWLV